MSQPYFFAPTEYYFFPSVDITGSRPRELLSQQYGATTKLFDSIAGKEKKAIALSAEVKLAPSAFELINSLLKVIEDLQKKAGCGLSQALDAVHAMQRQLSTACAQLSIEKLALQMQLQKQQQVLLKELHSQTLLRERLQTSLHYSAVVCPGMRGLYHLPIFCLSALQQELVRRSAEGVSSLLQDLQMLVFEARRREKELSFLDKAHDQLETLIQKEGSLSINIALPLEGLYQELVSYCSSLSANKSLESILIEGEALFFSPDSAENLGLCTSGKHIFDKVIKYAKEKRIDGGLLIMPSTDVYCKELSSIECKEKILCRKFTILLGIERAEITIYAGKRSLKLLKEEEILKEIARTARAAEALYPADTYFTPSGFVFAGIAGVECKDHGSIRVIWSKEELSKLPHSRCCIS
jgi:hypothetical protein